MENNKIFFIVFNLLCLSSMIVSQSDKKLKAQERGLIHYDATGRNWYGYICSRRISFNGNGQRVVVRKKEISEDMAKTFISDAHALRIIGRVVRQIKLNRIN